VSAYRAKSANNRAEAKSAPVKSFQKPRRLHNASAWGQPITNQLAPGSMGPLLALLEVLLRTPAENAVEKRPFKPRQTLHAPHLIDIEVTQVIRRYAAGCEIDRERARAAVIDLIDFPFRRCPHDFRLRRVWDLRDNLTACDAVYVALAEALDTILLTRDQRLAAAPGHCARIQLI
jgi:predicted nucleic acid-binding protein